MRANFFAILAGAAFATAPAPAASGATDFILVNRTTTDMASISVRSFRGGPWKFLAIAPRAAARIAVPFREDGCAFDIRATLADKETLVWSGVNLCEAKAVILNRDSSGLAWVDYD